MHLPDRQRAFVRHAWLVSIALLLAVRPALGWQFRDVTAPDHRTDSPRVAMTPKETVPKRETAATRDQPKPRAETQDAASAEAASQDSEIRPIRFNKVAAGQTTVDQLEQLWGAPLKTEEANEQSIWKYTIAPFRQVDVTLADGVVTSMLIYLDEPLDPTLVAEEMGLDRYVAVPIPDAQGKVLGQAYPERGVLFSLSSDLDRPQARRIQLEAITPELFLLRAEYDFRNECQRDLDDLDMALKLDPDYARAHWWRAEVLAKIGQYQSALNSASAAVRLEPDSPQFRLTRARLLAINGKYDDALRETADVRSREGLAAELQARAECQMGDLIANGPKPAYKEAMQHHLAAIRIAAPMADESRFAIRRAAKRVLVDAHLAVALDIARGDFRNKTQVTAKWLERSHALVDDLIAEEQGDPVVRLWAMRTELLASAKLNGALEAAEPTERAIELGRELVAAEDDELNQSRVQWELGLVLFEAMRVARIQKNHELALRHGDNAIVLFEQSAPKRQSTPAQKFTVARLYFLIGTIHAVQKSDHKEAVAWYDKAEPLLKVALPEWAQADAGLHGERFVSMGVSYWETGDHERAIEVTEYGLEVMRQAEKDNKIQSESLAVPYGNLAAMHRHVGNAAKAKEYAQLASNLEPPPEESKPR